MYALKKEPGKKPEWVDIESDLKPLQEAVGGYIETVTFDDFIVICDEEGRLKGKERNCRIEGISFVGTILIVGKGRDDFLSLPERVAYWLEWEEEL